MEFVDIPNYDNYAINRQGIVINKKTGRELKPCLDTWGYKCICLCENSIKKTHKIHTILGELFIDGRTDEKNTIDHIDRNKLNNNLENLRWATKSQQAVNRCFGNNKLNERNISESRGRFWVVIKRGNFKYQKVFTNLDEAKKNRDEILNNFI
jgi:hypothetical protein